MTKYNVEETQTVVRWLYFTVEAESPEEAVALVESGDEFPHNTEEDITQSSTRVMDD